MIDLHAVMSSLAVKRPVFHSEADFQHALAWEVHEQYPELAVRLEYPGRAFCHHSAEAADFGAKWHVDIWLGSRRRSAAVELKYMKKRLSQQVGAEWFDLPDGTGDIGRRALLADVSRLEALVRCGATSAGYLVVLANDPSYWLGATPRTLADSFDCSEGTDLSGTFEWSDRASEGSKRGMEQPITIRGSYRCRWHDYSQVECANGVFRYLAIEVRRKDA